MRNPKVPPVRLLLSAAVLFFAMNLLVVFLFSLPGKPFHGYAVGMERDTIITLRTAFAGISIFLLFPLVVNWSRRGSADSKQKLHLTAWAFLLAEIPVALGLTLFLLRGAFKTFFVFLALSAVYMILAWPRD